jgi:hypothetical protein
LLLKSSYTQQQSKGVEGDFVFVSAVGVRCMLVVEQTTSLDFDLLIKAKSGFNTLITAENAKQTCPLRRLVLSLYRFCNALLFGA